MALFFLIRSSFTPPIVANSLHKKGRWHSHYHKGSTASSTIFKSPAVDCFFITFIHPFCGCSCGEQAPPLGDSSSDWARRFKHCWTFDRAGKETTSTPSLPTCCIYSFLGCWKSIRGPLWIVWSRHSWLIYGMADKSGNISMEVSLLFGVCFFGWLCGREAPLCVIILAKERELSMFAQCLIGPWKETSIYRQPAVAASFLCCWMSIHRPSCFPSPN